VYLQRSVLIVDADRDFRDSLCNLLAARDFRVHSAASGAAALARLARSSIDALILDVFMPRLDGLGVLRALRGRPEAERPRIILVIAYYTGLCRPILGLDVHRVFSKPIDDSELIDELARGLSEEAAALRRVARYARDSTGFNSSSS